MPQLFTNNARALLTAGITASATSLTVEAAKADLFPTANVGTGTLPSANNWFKATLQNAAGDIEIIYVRTRTSGSAVFSNVLRGQEGTTAIAFPSGAVVGLRVTSADMQAAINILSSTNTFTGSNSFAGPVAFAGATSFAELISGSINGNAATVTNGVYTTGAQTIAVAKTFAQDIAVAGAVVRTAASGAGYLAQGTNGVTNAGVYYDPATGEVSTWTASNKRVAVDTSGNMTVTGNITGFSDERVKTDWAPLPDDFVERAAQVKFGTFTRTDTGERQAGSSAQDWQRLLPEVVQDGEHLSLAYGNAALVLALKLAQEIVALRAEVAALKGA